MEHEGLTEADTLEHLLEHYARFTPLGASACPDVHMPSAAKAGLETLITPTDLEKNEGSSKNEAKSEKSHKSALNSLDELLGVHWSEKGFGWYQCSFCGYTKLTCWQGETFTGKPVWLCEDCYSEWEEERRQN